MSSRRSSTSSRRAPRVSSRYVAEEPVVEYEEEERPRAPRTSRHHSRRPTIVQEDEQPVVQYADDPVPILPPLQQQPLLTETTHRRHRHRHSDRREDEDDQQRHHRSSRHHSDRHSSHEEPSSRQSSSSRSGTRSSRHRSNRAAPLQRSRKDAVFMTRVAGTEDYTQLAPHRSPVPSQGLAPVYNNANDHIKTAQQLQRERDIELAYLQNSMQRPPPGALDVIRESAGPRNHTQADQYARFRERMDHELGQMDFGAPPPNALDCAKTNSRLPPGPTAEDMNQWRLRELNEAMETQRAVAYGGQTQDYYY